MKWILTTLILTSSLLSHSSDHYRSRVYLIHERYFSLVESENYFVLSGKVKKDSISRIETLDVSNCFGYLIKPSEAILTGDCELQGNIENYYLTFDFDPTKKRQYGRKNLISVYPSTFKLEQNIFRIRGIKNSQHYKRIKLDSKVSSRELVKLKTEPQKLRLDQAEVISVNGKGYLIDRGFYLGRGETFVKLSKTVARPGIVFDTDQGSLLGVITAKSSIIRVNANN